MMWQRLVFTSAICAIAGCAAILCIDDGTPRETTDANPSDVIVPLEAAGPCNLAAPFGTPLALGSLNTSSQEQHPRLAQDELTIYFQRGVVDAGFDLFTATRPDAGTSFDPPIPITALDTPSNDVDLSVSPDGLRAYFASDRAGGLGAYDVWQASRDAAASAFGAVGTVPNVSSTQNDHETYYVPGALYIVSDRGSGGDDIYRAAEQSGSFSAPLLIPELASPSSDGFPAVSFDETRIYFASLRGDAGSFGVWTSTHSVSTTTWEAPTPVTELGSFGNVLPAWISADGCRLYFSSDHAGDFDLYVTAKPAN